MSRMLIPFLIVTSCFAISVAAFGADGQLLWQLGTPDNDNAEFALAPSDHARYRRDAFFIVGRSETEQDWPYFQPGPADRDFGSKPHTFTVVFGLKTVSPEGQCRLLVDLINTHFKKPPKLEITINGTAFERQMRLGADDAAFNGEPAKGKERLFDVTFPASLLKVGQNDIRITTVSGSMVLYDWLGLEAPASIDDESLGITFVDGCQITPHLLVSREDTLCHPVSAELHHFGPPAEIP